MPRGLIHTWNLKRKINHQDRNRLTDTENRSTVSGWDGRWQMAEKEEEIKKEPSAAAEKSRGREAR